jgi:hypothetical protein
MSPKVASATQQPVQQDSIYYLLKQDFKSYLALSDWQCLSAPEFSWLDSIQPPTTARDGTTATAYLQSTNDDPSRNRATPFTTNGHSDVNGTTCSNDTSHSPAAANTTATFHWIHNTTGSATKYANRRVDPVHNLSQISIFPFLFLPLPRFNPNAANLADGTL